MPEPAVKSYFRTPHKRQTDVDISSVSFWSRGFEERDQAFARLRSEAPVSWHPPLETPGLPKRSREAGFWAVTKAADIAFISRRHDLFSSEIGKVDVRPTPFRTIPNMLILDPPLHTAYRRLVSAAFTPRAIATMTTTINRRARQVVLRAGQQREFDFVSAISAQLPVVRLQLGHQLGPAMMGHRAGSSDLPVRCRGAVLAGAAGSVVGVEGHRDPGPAPGGRRAAPGEPQAGGSSGPIGPCSRRCPGCCRRACACTGS